MTATMRYSRNPNLAAGFQKEAREIVKYVIDRGWVGRKSNKGHIILRAPDGKTTTSVQHDLSERHAIQNTWAPIRAWERRVTNTLAKDDRGNLILECPHCEPGQYVAKTKMGLVSHLTVQHAETRVCPICKKPEKTQATYIKHLNNRHPELSSKDGAEITTVDEADEIDEQGIVDEPDANAVADESDVDAAAEEPDLADEPEESDEPLTEEAPETDTLEEHHMTIATPTPAPVEEVRAAFPYSTPRRCDDNGRVTFPHANPDYSDYTTEELMHAVAQFPLITKALNDRFNGHFSNIAFLREALATI